MQEIITAKQFQKLMNEQPQQTKFHNRFKVYDGVKYHSVKEAKYAMDLDMKKKAGIISDWKRQYKIPIIINGQFLCNYIIDFWILYPNGQMEIVEVKGMELPVWKLKWKLLHILRDQLVPFTEITLLK
jgi:hypothetical protein